MQLAYNNLPGNALPGLVLDIGFHDIVSRIVATRQLEKVVVTTAANAEIFTITIDGVAYAYTSDGSGTKPEISAGLKALIDAGDADVTVTDDTTDTLLIESNNHDKGFVISVTNPATGVLTLTQLVAQEEAIGFGIVVVEDEQVSSDSNTGKREGVRLPRIAADITTLGKTLGVAICDTSRVTRTSAPYGGYGAGEALGVLKRGRIWMPVEDVATVALGGLVYVRVVASGANGLGQIRAADDGGNTDVLPFASAHFTGQKVGSGTTGLAVVEWNL